MRTTTQHATRRTFIVVAAFLALSGTAKAAELAAVRLIHGGATNAHTVYVGLDDNWLVVDGDGSSDLDCWVSDQYGEPVDSDTDSTDYCILETPGMGPHRLVIKNLGRRTNSYEIRQLSSLR